MSQSVEIKHCGRCGGHHRDLLVQPLPGLVDGPRSHYVVCPVKDEPLYIDPTRPNAEEPGPPAPAAIGEEGPAAPPSGKRKRELAGTA